MQSSYRILRIFGISVELHISFIFFFLLLLLFGLSTLLFFLIIFILVLIHELFHSIVALKFGIRVPKITLTPIGGLASIEVPENPKKELLISIAGPFSNFLFMILVIPIFVFTPLELQSYGYLIQESGIGESGIPVISYFLNWIFWINFILFFFNLLPGFPMDGGRIFRALLAFEMDYIRATKIAVQVGQIIAIGMILNGLGFIDFIGFFLNIITLILNLLIPISNLIGIEFAGNPWLFVIGIFLFFAGNQELPMIRVKHAVRGMTIGSVAIPNLRYVNESTTIREFLDLIAYPQQDHYPVTDYSGRLLGILDIENLKEIKQEDFDKIPVRNLANRNFDIVDAHLKIEDKLATLLTKDFILVVDSGQVIGYLTPDHLLEIARFYGIKKRR